MTDLPATPEFIQSENPPSTDVKQTQWLIVILALLSGVLAASQIGAAHSALPVIRRELSLSLMAGSWVISGINVVGLFAATLIGIVAVHYGFRRFISSGFIIVAISALWGARAGGQPELVVSRLFEGIGFVMIIIGAPSLIAAVTRPRDQRLTLAIWGAYMPAGIALATWFGPAIMSRVGWRGLWTWSSIALIVFAVLFEVLTRRAKISRSVEMAGAYTTRDIRRALSNPGALYLALIFGCFTTQHQGILALYPSFLQEHYHLAPSQAGYLDSIVMASNIIGSVAAGILLRRGFLRTFLMLGGLSVMAFCAIGIFSLNLSWQGSFIFAFILSCVGGVVPGCVFASVPQFSETPRDIPTINGLLVQGSKLGFVLGPIVLSGIVGQLSWSVAPMFTIPAAILGAVLVIMLARSPQAKSNYLPGSRNPVPERII